MLSSRRAVRLRNRMLYCRYGSDLLANVSRGRLPMLRSTNSDCKSIKTRTHPYVTCLRFANGNPVTATRLLAQPLDKSLANCQDRGHCPGGACLQQTETSKPGIKVGRMAASIVFLLSQQHQSVRKSFKNVQLTITIPRTASYQSKKLPHSEDSPKFNTSILCWGSINRCRVHRQGICAYPDGQRPDVPSTECTNQLCRYRRSNRNPLQLDDDERGTTFTCRPCEDYYRRVAAEARARQQPQQQQYEQNTREAARQTVMDRALERSYWNPLQPFNPAHAQPLIAGPAVAGPAYGLLPQPVPFPQPMMAAAPPQPPPGPAEPGHGQGPFPYEPIEHRGENWEEYEQRCLDAGMRSEKAYKTIRGRWANRNKPVKYRKRRQ